MLYPVMPASSNRKSVALPDSHFGPVVKIAPKVRIQKTPLAMLARYNQLLLKRPILTNVISAGIVFGLGDFLAQKLFSEESEYNYKRTLRSVFFGAVVFAPIGDKWYKLLAKFGNRSTKDILARVAVDQLVFAPFVGIPLYYSVMTLLEGKPVSEVPLKLQKTWLPTVLDNWKVWPAFQCFNFWLVPVRYRLLSGNLFGVGWNCYLSFNLHKTDQAGIIGA